MSDVLLEVRFPQHLLVALTKLEWHVFFTKLAPPQSSVPRVGAWGAEKFQRQRLRLRARCGPDSHAVTRAALAAGHGARFRQIFPIVTRCRNRKAPCEPHGCWCTQFAWQMAGCLFPYSKRLWRTGVSTSSSDLWRRLQQTASRTL